MKAQHTSLNHVTQAWNNTSTTSNDFKVVLNLKFWLACIQGKLISTKNKQTKWMDTKTGRCMTGHPWPLKVQGNFSLVIVDALEKAYLLQSCPLCYNGCIGGWIHYISTKYSEITPADFKEIIWSFLGHASETSTTSLRY